MSKHDWKSLSTEALVTLALKELGANDIQHLARTSDVLDTLMLMGCSIAEDDLRRRLVQEAVLRERENVRSEDGKQYWWNGSRWIGAPHDRPWDRHGWCLPLWKLPGA